MIFGIHCLRYFLQKILIIYKILFLKNLQSTIVTSKPTTHVTTTMMPVRIQPEQIVNVTMTLIQEKRAVYF
jgi:hypothetical protein